MFVKVCQMLLYLKTFVEILHIYIRPYRSTLSYCSAAVVHLFRPHALDPKHGRLVQLALTWTLTKNDAGPLVSTRQIYIATGEQG